MDLFFKLDFFYTFNSMPQKLKIVEMEDKHIFDLFDSI